MTQGVEAFIGVSNEAGGTQLRLLKFLVGQPDGTVGPVFVEGAILVDPQTGQAVRPMTYDQAETIIELLQRIACAVEQRHEP